MTAGLALGACSSPAPQPDARSPDPVERTLAAAEIIRSEDRSRVPELITMLDSHDPAVRMLAIGGLERLTGQTLGYSYADPEPKRTIAIDRWVRWARGEPHSEASSDP